MYITEIDHMDLEQLALSGQCFRMRRLDAAAGGGNWWSVTFADHYVQILQEGKKFTFSCEKEEFDEVWYSYFDMDTDYGAIKNAADSGDAYLQAAIRCGGGVRILRQDLWEMIITFLISQNNNITRITASVDALCKKFGEKLTGAGSAADGYYGFPAPEAIAAEGLSGLAGLGLGYRDRYIARMAELCCKDSGERWLESLKNADYETAHAMLLEQMGIGNKVADCICLFGLHHIEAFPIDTHVKQIVKTYYPKGFPLERYRGYAGIVQQYLFFYKINGQKIEAENMR